MITKIATSWPSVRQIIYTALAALFGALTLFGILTDAQVSQYLGYATTILGALGFLLAQFYTPGGARPPTATADTVVIAEPAKTTPVPTAHEVIADATEAIGRINAQVGPTVGQLRAQLEARLSGR